MNKKTLTALICLFMSISLFAASKSAETDISMVSYEQSWLDSEGTLALKNNTKENIHNIKFLIVYQDMSGKQLHYEEFSKKVSIAPGMTRKINIKAYEHERNYHYYKSENLPGGSPAFKIEFKLLDYNTASPEIREYPLDSETETEADTETDEIFYSMFPYLLIVFVLLTIGICIGSYVLVAVMAKKRKREAAVWILLSFFATPILIIIILLCIGDADRT